MIARNFLSCWLALGTFGFIGMATATAATQPKLSGKALESAILKSPGFKLTGELSFPAELWSTDDVIAKSEKDMKKEAKRSIASGLSEADMSAPYRQFVQEWTAVETPKQLDDLLAKYDDDAFFDKLPVDARFVVAQILPLRAFRGFVYRLKPLAMQARITDSLLVTWAKTLAGASASLFPEAHNQAALRYFTEPFEDDIATIKSEAELQNFLTAKAYPAIRKVSVRLHPDKLKLSEHAGKYLVWDAKLVFGKDSFAAGEEERFRHFGESERLAVLSAAHATMYGIAFVNAFELKGMMAATKDFGRMVGFDTLGADVDGFSARKRVALFKRYTRADGATWNMAKPAFLDRRCENAKEGAQPKCLDLAYRHLKDSIIYASSLFEITQKSPEDMMKLIDPGVLKPFGRTTGLALSLQKKLVNDGTAEVRSNVTGKTVTVDLKKFFVTEPPTSLAEFLPRFSGGEEAEYKTETRGGQKVTYRIFTANRATTWDEAKFTPYVRGGVNVEEKARILNSAWGGWLVGVPMLAVF